MNAHNQRKRFEDLLSQYLDGEELEEPESRELAQLLEGDPHCARDFLEAVQFDRQLSGVLASSVPDEEMIAEVFRELGLTVPDGREVPSCSSDIFDSARVDRIPAPAVTRQRPGSHSSRRVSKQRLRHIQRSSSAGWWFAAAAGIAVVIGLLIFAARPQRATGPRQ